MAKIDLKDYLERLEEPEDREAVASQEYQRELFEQYVQKGTNFPELRAQLLEEYRAGAELTGPQGLRRKLGAVDLGYFGRAYLPHYFVRPSPPFHEELDRIFREGVMKGQMCIRDRIIRRLKTRHMMDCIVVKEDVSKEALKKYGEDTVNAVGATWKQQDVFGYELNFSKLEQVKAGQ